MEDGKISRLLPRLITHARRNYLVDWNKKLALSRKEEINGHKPQNVARPHIYILNLRRTRARALEVERQLSTEKVPYTLFAAVDGAEKFDDLELATFAGRRRKQLFALDLRRRMTFDLNLSTARNDRLFHERMRFGCYLTHVRVWKELLYRSFPHILVLEDDVVLAENFLTTLVQLRGKLPSSWDLLYLNSGYTQVAGQVRPGILQVKGALGTYAYLISPSGAKKLVEDVALSSDAPIDHVLDKGIYTGKLSAFQTDPPLAFHEDRSLSTLGY